MANLTKNEKYIVDMYVRYFGKAPSKAEIAKYNDFKTPKLILTEIRGDADETKSLNTEEFVNNAFQNLFGRNATTKEMNKYSKVVDAGKDLPINAIVKSAKKSDKGVYEAKKAIAIMLAEKENTTIYNLDKITKDTYADVYNLKTKKLLVDSVAQLETKVDAMKDNVAGQTFNLTASVDPILGTDKSDLVKATVNNNGTDFTGTLSSLDSIDGGAGVDTLLIQDIRPSANTKGINLEDATIKNVEIIEIQSANKVESTTSGTALDVSGIAGLNTLNVTKAKAVNVKAAATTDVNVSGATGTAIDVAGGKNVVVNDATANNNITVSTAGATGNAVGTITVTDTKVGIGVITVDGGTDVTVTASGLTDNNTVGTIEIGTAKAATGNVVVTATGADYVAATASALGDIKVTGGKTITVTQIATSDDSAAASDKAAKTITLGDVTVAADATTTEIKVINDTAVVAKNAANTTGGATTSDSVKFADLGAGKTIILGGLTLTATVNMTAAEVAAAFANLSADAVIPNDGSADADGDTQGSAAASKGIFSGSIDGWTTGAASGDTVVFTSTTENAIIPALTLGVTSTGTATVTSVSTGKAHNATATGGVMGIANALVDITATASVTTVTVDGFAGSSVIKDATTNTALATINLSNGIDMDIDSAAATLALNLNNVTGTVDVIANTTTINAKVDGDSTATIESATVKTLNVTAGNGEFTADASATKELAAATAISTVGFTGTANVTLDGATTTYTGGASVDNVTVADATTGAAGIAKAIDLGAGDDKLILSGNAVKVPAVELKGGAGEDTLSITATSAALLDDNTLFAAKLNSFERLELTAVTTQDINVKNLGFANYVTVNGTAVAATLSNLANNATVVVDADVTTSLTVKVENDATSTTNVLNVVYAKEGNLTGNDLIATEIETVNLTVTDIFADDGTGKDTTDATHSLNFDSAKATSLNIDGTAVLNLTLDSNTVKLVTIDASKMTEGGLEVTANGKNAMTITGGAGNDVLTASTGATAKADILVGGAGNDTLFAGSNGAKLTGGAGNDLFVLSANATGFGTKEATTHSYITDFKAGDLLKLTYFDIDNDGVGADTALGNVAITSFTKLAANQSANAVYTDYVNAAMQQIDAASTVSGNAVWFSFAGNSYVIVDSGAASAGTFTNGGDLAIELTGVANLDNASFNLTYGTIAL